MKIFFLGLLLSCTFSLGAEESIQKDEKSNSRNVDETVSVSPYWNKSASEKIEIMKKFESRFVSLREAATKGNAAVKFELAMYYIEKEKYMDDSSFKKIWKSAQKGYSLAQSALGEIYGRWSKSGRDGDKKESLYWYKKAVAQEEPHAMYNLGRIYRDGCGVNKNADKARIWFEKSAKKGNEEAKKALAEMTKN